MEKPIQVFCCYAREDLSFLLTLKKHLRQIQREGLIIVQADIDISPGEDWEQKISHYLDTASMILLLISSDFMDSDYCYSKEMMKAMERHKSREARVIPIILRPTHWQRAPFGKLQVLPTNAEPVTSKDWHTPDDAFFNVTQGIEEAVDQLIIQSQAKVPTVRQAHFALEETLDSSIATDDFAKNLQYPPPIQETISKIEIKTNQTRNTEQSSKDPFDAIEMARQSALNNESTAALLEVYKDKIEEAKKEKFIFLLVGRTGVGKSSSVNSLMEKEVAPVGAWEPTTMSVESYDNDAYGIKFTVIDTPGLCDDLAEANKDYIYLKRMLDGAPQFDCLWFVTPLGETRIRADEKRAIKLIGQTFGREVWKHAIIVFTFSNNVRPENYQEAFKMRTQLIRMEIARWTGISVAAMVPAVAIDNKAKTTPDGREWLGELYVTVFTHISDRGFLPFLLATAERLLFVK